MSRYSFQVIECCQLSSNPSRHVACVQTTTRCSGRRAVEEGALSVYDTSLPIWCLHFIFSFTMLSTSLLRLPHLSQSQHSAATHCAAFHHALSLTKTATTPSDTNGSTKHGSPQARTADCLATKVRCVFDSVSAFRLTSFGHPKCRTYCEKLSERKGQKGLA